MAQPRHARLQLHHSSEGHGYYYDPVTGQSQWADDATTDNMAAGFKGPQPQPDIEAKEDVAPVDKKEVPSLVPTDDRELLGDDDSNFTERSGLSFSLAGAVDTDRSREVNVVRTLSLNGDTYNPVVRKYAERKENEQKQQEKMAHASQTWHLTHTQDGTPYYWNSTTNETTYDRPASFSDRDEPGHQGMPQDVKEPLHHIKEQFTNNPEQYQRKPGGTRNTKINVVHSLHQSNEPSQAGWTKIVGDDGSIYYWNQTTNETSWDPPKDLLRTDTRSVKFAVEFEEEGEDMRTALLRKYTNPAWGVTESIVEFAASSIAANVRRMLVRKKMQLLVVQQMKSDFARELDRIASGEIDPQPAADVQVTVLPRQPVSDDDNDDHSHDEELAAAMSRDFAHELRRIASGEFDNGMDHLEDRANQKKRDQEASKQLFGHHSDDLAAGHHHFARELERIASGEFEQSDLNASQAAKRSMSQAAMLIHRIQQNFLGSRRKKAVHSEEQKKLLEDAIRRKAALRIQANVRGHQLRKHPPKERRHGKMTRYHSERRIAVEADPASHGWEVHKDEHGFAYYWNSITNESTWDMPEQLQHLRETLEPDGAKGEERENEPASSEHAAQANAEDSELEAKPERHPQSGANTETELQPGSVIENPKAAKFAQQQLQEREAEEKRQQQLASDEQLREQRERKEAANRSAEEKKREAEAEAEAEERRRQELEEEQKRAAERAQKEQREKAAEAQRLLAEVRRKQDLEKQRESEAADKAAEKKKKKKKKKAKKQNQRHAELRKQASRSEREHQKLLRHESSFFSAEKMAELDRLAAEIAEQRRRRDEADAAEAAQWSAESNFEFYERLSRGSRFVVAGFLVQFGVTNTSTNTCGVCVFGQIFTDEGYIHRGKNSKSLAWSTRAPTVKTGKTAGL